MTLPTLTVADDTERGPRLNGTRLTSIDEPIQRRESLLAASAQASRLLLESSDALAAMPEVLRLLGEAAEVDRTALALAEVGPGGDRWLVIKSEWTADGINGQGTDGERMAWNERKSDCFCSELRAGRSVYVCRSPGSFGDSSIASDAAKSSVIVPFLVDGEYAGAVGFDACREEREFNPAVVSALEIAASVIGAALHRERLVETMRRERELAAEQRMAELARSNAALRSNLERLASEPDLCSFLGHALLETTRQLGAAGGTAVVLNPAADEWQIMANVRDGHLEEPQFQTKVPDSQATFQALLDECTEPTHYAIDETAKLTWPGALDYHRREGHRSIYVLPLVFGQRNVGFIGLHFRAHDPAGLQRSELLVALAQQATLAIGLKRLAVSAKNAAVLAERNRIGQEIHDGLAQAFTGILMQLGAAEELVQGSPLAVVMNRIRDIAREGLAEARRSVLALRPSEPRPGGLEQALRQLAERSTVTGRINSTFEGGGGATGVPPEHEHQLLRIAQEAVINAVRHAQPHTIRIALVTDPNELALRVTDDGIGMEDLPGLYAQQGFGLANMRERAQAIGGEWRLESKPGAGTQVSVRIPRVVRA